jgi:hypothetical protein
MAEVTVPLVTYHKDRRVEIGTATVDTDTLEGKAYVDSQGGELLEVTGAVFSFSVRF